ncbi:MAG: Crp/Fnr family transcriptional regulator [Kangiellaceae bacterium]|nr:Crp/Fnr family transcriptional regulator [Kangiellaceae bacterium]
MTLDQKELMKILSVSTSLPEVGAEKLLLNSKLIQLKSDTIIMQEQQTSSDLFAVKSGLLRAVFSTENGKEFSKEFYWENDIIFAMRSLIQSTPLAYSVVSEEDCELYKIPKEYYLSLVSQYSEWKEYHIHHLEQHLLHKEFKEELLLLHSKEQRVLRVYQTYPHLVRRVPDSLVASYLGLTPVSLSRIKKRLGL